MGLMSGTSVSDGTFRVQARGQNAYPYALLGTFSPYLVVHRTSLVKIDPAIPFEAAALVSCGVTTGYGSAVRAAAVRPGEDVAVVGIGDVGMSALQGAVQCRCAFCVRCRPGRVEARPGIEIRGHPRLSGRGDGIWRRSPSSPRAAWPTR